MASFQKIVLTVAIIVLILVLIFIGVSLTFASPDVWPPLVAQCPDYWTMTTDGSGNNPICINDKNLGTCNLKTMNFNQPQFTGSNGVCNKYLWTQKCGVSWDGLSYGVPNPCTPPPTTTS